MSNPLRKAYEWLPFKRELFSLLKTFYIPPPRIYQHLHFRGKIHVKPAESRSFYIYHHGFLIENELFWRGIDNGWEKTSLTIWKTLSKEARVIFDLGANTGVYSLLAVAASPEAEVHAFEPVKRVYEKLVQNVALNRFRIFCNEVAASDQDGTGTIYDTDNAHTYSVTVNANRQPDATKVHEVKIKLAKLDTYIQEHNITRLDLMKIDVEAHELEVLAGFAESLRRFKPNMVIEILSKEIGLKIKEAFAELDYTCYSIDEAKNTICRTEAPVPHGENYNFVFCRPDTVLLLEKVFNI